MSNDNGLEIMNEAKRKFELACKSAEGLQILNNFGAAFTAVNVITLLREALTDDVVRKVFVPLMNTKVGFLTDRNGRPRSNNRPALPLYNESIVRDAIIDAVSIGLMPTGNQFNIIAERMYPTKEGYTALLRRLGVKYFIDVSYDRSQTPGFAEIPCKVSYSYNGEKNNFNIVATVKKDDYSSPDQLRGKAERRAKKTLYEYITGCDFGDADENSAVEASFVDVTNRVAEEIETNANQAEIGMSDAIQEETSQAHVASPQPQTTQDPQPEPAQSLGPGF